MTEEQRHDQLDEQVDDLISQGRQTPTGDANLDALLRVASSLRGLSDPDFKERLRAELIPQPARGRWLPFIGGILTLARVQRAFRRPAVVATLAFAAGAAAVAVIAFLFLGVIGDGDERELSQELLESEFTLTAEMADAIGIERDTEFVLTSEERIDVELVHSLLQVEPAVELDVEREDAHRYRITPAEPLEPGRVYHFSLAETASAPHVLASWAFQTKSPIGIVQTLPRDQATGVPLNTGIELTFSHDSVQNLAGHLQIDPPVEGRFEVHKRVVVFVPKELMPGTLYTVTVRAGVGVRGTNDVMADDFVLQFETGGTERSGLVPSLPVRNFSRKISEASTTETPALQMYSSHAMPAETTVGVYRYPALERFLAAFQEFQDLPSWASVTRDSFLAETGGLELVATFEAAVEQLDRSGSFLRFPEPLPEGFYLVQVQFEDRPIQAWLQVTDVATYLSVSRDKTLVWVNDLATKGPLEGARIQLLGTADEAVTDAEGIAFFETPAEIVSSEPTGRGYVRAETSGNLLVTAPDGRVAVVPLQGVRPYSYYGSYNSYGYTYAGDEYWHYISTDRPLYLPSDTVRFWGVARQRENPPASETLTVELTGSDYFDYYYRPVRIAETEVSTSSLGTFSGELSFQGLSPGYYGLTVKAGDQPIDSIGIAVETYTKPAYTIDVVPSRQAVFAGEEVDFAVKATFFEGSPVPQLRLRYSGDVSNELTTDEQGEAVVTITAQPKGTYRVSSTFLSFTPVLAEEGEIIGEAWVSVHPASLTISASSELEDDQGIIEGTVHHVDLSRINDGSAKGFDDYLGDPAGGVTVSARVTEVSWERREVGEYYDFIAKIVRKEYEYDRIETPLGTFALTTDAGGAFQHTFPVDAEKYYEIDLSVTDASGREATRDLFLSGRRSLYNARSDLVYLADPAGSTRGFGGSNDFSIGDEVVLEMRRGADLLPSDGESRYLFYQAQNGLREYRVQADSTLRFPFDEGDVPSTTVLGVWFNGRN